MHLQKGKKKTGWIIKSSLSPLLPRFHVRYLMPYGMPYGAVMVLAFNVTAVCANALPVITAPVFSEINV